MLFDETLTLDSPRRTSDGSLVASVLAARTGIQDYAGYELGKPEMARVRVYRPAESVFNRDSMASFASAPVTLEHPPVPVVADNWKQYAVGDLGEDVVRDGEAVRVPLIVRDAAAITAIDTGKREISMGYSCELVWGDGVTPEGETYHAIQRGIKVNHLAIVDKARGGSKLRIGDRRETAHPLDGELPVATKTITFDGLPVEVTDAAEAVINKLLASVSTLTQAKDTAETQVGTLTATVSTKDGEIAALNAKLKDAEVTPAKLQQLADARAKVITDAKAIAGDTLVVDGKTDVEIKRAAVAAKLGDAAAALDDNAIGGAFAALAATPGNGAPVNDAARQAIANGTQPITDASKARVESEERDRNAWKGKAA